MTNRKKVESLLRHMNSIELRDPDCSDFRDLVMAALSLMLACPPIPEDFDLPDWIDAEIWEGYLDVRKAKKAARTPRAYRAVVKQLEAFRARGHDPNAILETSIRSNWTDVYEPKTNGGSNGHIFENQYDAARRRIREEAMAEEQDDDFSGTEGG
jgi:hypothetical protein